MIADFALKSLAAPFPMAEQLLMILSVLTRNRNLLGWQLNQMTKKPRAPQHYIACEERQMMQIWQ